MLGPGLRDRLLRRQVIIFLHLLDHGSVSKVILYTNGLSLLIEGWKVRPPQLLGSQVHSSWRILLDSIDPLT